jgi:hypothetical protein
MVVAPTGFQPSYRFFRPTESLFGLRDDRAAFVASLTARTRQPAMRVTISLTVAPETMLQSPRARNAIESLLDRA